MNKEITYKITEHIGVLSRKSNGYQKELNLVSWNGAAILRDSLNKQGL